MVAAMFVLMLSSDEFHRIAASLYARRQPVSSREPLCNWDQNAVRGRIFPCRTRPLPGSVTSPCTSRGKPISSIVEKRPVAVGNVCYPRIGVGRCTGRVVFHGVDCVSLFAAMQ